MGRVIFYPPILFEAVNVQQVLRSPDISGFAEMGEMTKFTEMTLSRTIMVQWKVTILEMSSCRALFSTSMMVGGIVFGTARLLWRWNHVVK